MALHCTLNLPYTFPSPMKHNLVVANSPACGTPLFDRRSRVLNCIRFRTDDVRRSRGSRLRLNAAARSTDSEEEEEEEEEDDEDKQNDPSLMDEEERLEWRRAIKEALRKIPDVPEEMDPAERSKKVQQLLAKYPLVVEEDDPDWPEDSDGWGFNFSQFFDKITIKNNPKKDDEDNDDDSDDEIVWKDDNYIRPIKDVKTAEWEETVFKDISPLIILVHHRYRRPKENEKVRDELEKAVHIIWNCRLPSPRCVAVDAVVETDLVSALQVSAFPEMIFTKAGKILYREKAIRTADELSKIMAFFYYGGAKPPCLNITGDIQESIPTVPLSVDSRQR